MALLLLTADSHLLTVNDPINRNDARTLRERCVHPLADLAKVDICLEGNRDLVRETFACSSHVAGSVNVTILIIITVSRQPEVRAVCELALLRAMISQQTKQT
jgi:hypothetical protein